MSTRSLSGFDLRHEWNTAKRGASGTLVITLSRSVVSEDGVEYPATKNAGGALSSLGFHWESAITVTDGLATTGTISGLINTDVAIPGHVATYNIYVYDARGKMQEKLNSKPFHLHESLNSNAASFTWEQWVNAMEFTQFRGSTTFVGDQATVQGMLDAIAHVKASEVLIGESRLSVPPLSASDPVAVGLNDPSIPNYTLHSSKYASFNAAVAALDLLGGGTIIVDGPTAVSTNVSTTALTEIVFQGQGQLTGSSKTVTLLGPLSAPPIRIFASGVTVSFAGNVFVRNVIAEWWGASPSSSAAVNSIALNAANTSLCSISSGLRSAGDILLGGSGTYDINATVTLGSDALTFTGVGLAGTNGLAGTVVRWTGSPSGRAIYLTNGRYNRLRDFQLTSNVAHGTSVGLQITGPNIGTNTSGVTMERIDINEFATGCLIGDGSNGGHDASEVTMLGCTFDACDTGLRIDGANTLNINLFACNFDSNTVYGIDAYTGNVNVFGGAFGRNGIDVKQTGGGCVVINGMRTESNIIFDSQASAASSPVSLSNIVQSIVDDFTITNATNATPIAVTTASAHGYSTGDRVFIRNVGGNTAANGPWTITVTGASSFTLDASVGSGAYTSGGTGIKDHNPIRLGSGTQATISGCALRGSVNLNNGAGGVTVRISDCSTPFMSPLDVSDGNGNLALYTLDHTRRVDVNNLLAASFNEKGTVVGSALAPDSLSGTSILSSGTVNVLFTTRAHATYKISLSCNANETVRWSSKTTSGFTITSSNGGSTASVDWRIEN